MGKNKLHRWDELKRMPNVFQPEVHFYSPDSEMKGNWKNRVFKNEHPIVIEAGCGKGEYTVALAKKHPEKNFIGIDIKGARIWKGAKQILDEYIPNAAFLRIRIELIEKLFCENEADEIWLTFPDPQPQVSRENRRLTSPAMLNRFRKILKNGGRLHLKTDSEPLMCYTLQMLKQQPGTLIHHSFDIDASPFFSEDLGILTTYERMFRNEGKKICYLCFQFEK